MLEEIKGIGPKTLKALNELGIYSAGDLLSYYPYRYNVYKPSSIADAGDESILINGFIESIPRVFFIKKNLNKLSFRLNTESRLINVVVFNRAFLKKSLQINKQISVIGKYNVKTNTLTASDIKVTPILEEKVEGVYHLSSDIKRATFNKIIDNLLTRNMYVKNYIPDYLMKEYNFIDKLSAVKEIHKPTSLEKLKKSKVMLIYEELFVFMLKINYMKLYKINKISHVKNFNNDRVVNFINSLSFKLTKDQVNAIDEIKEDFNLSKKMNRLLLGDVGSGKTIVAFISLYMNYLSGYQGILMAPTEILAEQHYNNMISLFKGLDLKIELVTSSLSKKQKDVLYEKISNGKVDVLIGTHSVLNEKIVFGKLGLVITDEQHRFGVNQRKILAQKGSMVDVLYMSATPIPRTLALILYGDMDISQIKTKPSNRKEIQTKLYKFKDVKLVLNEMLDEIKNGHQIYVVAPLIEDEDGNSTMQNVTELYDKINLAYNHKIPISILHGKLSSKEKNEIMDNFKNGNIKILISTTVIEVGVDVKNATMMVIFNAERFGLATLHQLRGRIGRNELESKCLLISDFDTPRLKILEESNDGFYISEKDFELRGSGDLFGVKQHGDMSFKLANINTDYKILLQCQKDSADFLKNNLNIINNYLNQKEVISSINFND